MIKFYQKLILVILVIFSLTTISVYSITQQEYDELANDFDILNDDYSFLSNSYDELLEYSEELEILNEELVTENERLDIKLYEMEEVHEEEIKKTQTFCSSVYSFIILIILLFYARTHNELQTIKRKYNIP